MGGFNLHAQNANGTTGCKRSTYSAIVGDTVTDYVPHHNWFQYYRVDRQPDPRPPELGRSDRLQHRRRTARADPANHEYDLNDFYAAVKAGNFPAVSYIKMPAYQDGHAGNSDPLDEQPAIVELINFLQQQPEWKNTAVIVT